MRNNNDVVKNAKKLKTSDSFAFTWSVTTVIISVIISAVLLLAANASWAPVDFFKQKLSSVFGGVNITPGLPFIGGRQNILLLGVDSNGDKSDPFKGTRSDTIMVLNIDPITKSVNVVSIPRDSKVYIQGSYEADKINAAHAIGGPELTIRTIEQSFGIKINHYIAVDYAGIRAIVDAVGGVPVNVEKRMRYRDYSGGLNINLYPGYQVLNAEQAEGYLRFRHDAIGDIGRMQRQQWFIRGLVKKLQSPEIIVKLPQLIQLAGRYVRTDMNFYELSQLAAFSKAIDLSSVQTATLPGKPSKFGRVSYWIIDTDKAQEIIDRLIYRETSFADKGEPLTISILYSRNFSNKIDSIKESLTQVGYSVTCNSIIRGVHSQIIAHSNHATMKNADLIKQKIPELKNAQFVFSPNNYTCGESDFSLVLAND